VVTYVDTNVSEIYVSIFRAYVTKCEVAGLLVTGRMAEGKGPIRDNECGGKVGTSFATSALKMETVCISETLASTYETTWR
jgi:hypothetical protein